jgi:hypothetical protein
MGVITSRPRDGLYSQVGKLIAGYLMILLTTPDKIYDCIYLSMVA